MIKHFSLCIFLVGLIITLFIVSCKSSSIEKPQFYYGEYINTSEVGSTKLILRDDGHFDYRQIQGLLNLSSEGIFKINSGYLILNSFQKYKEDYVEVIEKKPNTKSTSVIRLIRNNNQALKEQILYLNLDYKNKYFTDDDGKIEVKKKIKSVGVMTISGEYLIKLDKEGFYQLDLKIVPENNLYFYFENDTLELTRNRIKSSKPKVIYKRQ